ncbi:NADH dehydrogenase subunit 1 [Tanacetum coccineum]
MYIAVPAEILGIILPLLLGVAFLVLAERKVMAFVQRRKGPDVVGSFGLLQPLADGFKLIIKEPISPSSANFSLFRMAPVATFMLSLVARAVVPFDYGMVLSDPNIGLLYLFAISSLGSHRPTVILKLPCLVEKKRINVRSLAVLFFVANWDRSPARLVPSCCVIFDLELLSLSFEFVFSSEIFKSFSLYVQFGRTSLTGFPAQSVRSSNAYALDSLYLLVLNTKTSQSRQHDMSESDSYYLSD